MKNVISSVKKRHIVYSEMLIIGILLSIFTISYPTPFQYFMIFCVNLLVLIFWHPRAKTFIDFSLFSLAMLVFFILWDEVYIAQKVGSFVFYLMFDIIFCEMRNQRFAYVSPIIRKYRFIEMVILKVSEKSLKFYRSNKTLLTPIFILLISALGVALVNGVNTFCLVLFR